MTKTLLYEKSPLWENLAEMYWDYQPSLSNLSVLLSSFRKTRRAFS
ncbi:MAG TPA: hypothetical protein VI451_18405 [Anaerolineales bacterium]|nr:hypothetical protein [Anaerolineales bacterium]